jgi:hypothetical protein
MPARLLLTTLLAALVTAAAVSAAVAINPKEAVLQSSDFPAGSHRLSFRGAKGTIKIPKTIHGQVFSVAYRFKNGTRTEVVANAVGTVSSSSDAHAVFVKLKKNLATFKPVHLPSYGNEQAAAGIFIKYGTVVVLLVRKGSALWEVAVSDIPGLSKSKAIAETRKYAGKEKARVG